MSIHNREPVNAILDQALETASQTFTTPLANADGSTSTVVQDLTSYCQQGRGVGGRPEQSNSIKYSILAVLVAFYLLVACNRTVSEANACRLLLHELTESQRRRLGMTADLTGTRYDLIAPGLIDGATEEAVIIATEELEKEHARFAKFYSEVVKNIDPSPFMKNRKFTNAQRNAILADPHHPDRRVSLQDSAMNQARLNDLIGKIITPSAMTSETNGWSGDIVTDETIVIISPVKAGHGTADDKRLSIDPDAEFWPGKADEDDFNKIGFGYGITYVLRAPRPYGQQIPMVAIGVHVGKPRGASAEDFEAALNQAERHGLTKENRERLCVADRGYTNLNTWIPVLLAHRYGWVSDYAKDMHRLKVLADTTGESGSRGKKVSANGPLLARGPILCPGAASIKSSNLPNRELASDLSADAIVELQRRVQLIEALAMPVRNALRLVKSTSGGRPKKNARPSAEFAITVECPARAGKVNCINYQRFDGTRTPGVPDVPNPPFPDPKQSHLRPRCCVQDFTTYRLDTTQIKWTQPHVWGSHYHEDLFETLRTANERYHSQLKSSDGAGMKERNWVAVRGIAKISILIAITTAVNNRNLIRSAMSKGELNKPSQAELRRRRRERIFSERRTKTA